MGIRTSKYVQQPVRNREEGRGWVFFFLHISTVIRSRDKVRQREPFLSRAESHNSVESELQRLHVPSFNADVLPLVRAHLLKTSMQRPPSYMYIPRSFGSPSWLTRDCCAPPNRDSLKYITPSLIVLIIRGSQEWDTCSDKLRRVARKPFNGRAWLYSDN